LIVALLAAWVASQDGFTGILAFVAYAFSIAASSFFAALVLGIFWKRTNKEAAVAGMSAGFVVCLWYLFRTHGAPADTYIFNTQPIAAGVFGIPVAFIVQIAVTMFTPEPDQATQDMVESVRYPSA